MNLENASKLKQIFMEIFSISESEVKSYRKMNNRKWDSLASVMLIKGHYRSGKKISINILSE